MREPKGRKSFETGIITSSRFAFMPMSTQALYFHLGVHSDKDGFVKDPKDICRAIGCSAKDMDLLVNSGYVLNCNVSDGAYVTGVREVEVEDGKTENVQPGCR